MCKIISQYIGDKQLINKKVLYNDTIGCVEYVQHMGNDLTIVNAARVSFGVEKDEVDERDKKLIRYLVKNRHTSTLEHNVVTFKFTVPLFVRGQHHRHRTWSYNEISRRYTDLNIQFYEPASFRTQHKSNRQASNEDQTINPEMEFDKTTAFQLVQNHHKKSLDLFYNTNRSFKNLIIACFSNIIISSFAYISSFIPTIPVVFIIIGFKSIK